MKYHEIFIICFLLALSIIYTKNKLSDLHYITSTVDNKEYLVRKMDDNIEAANLLAKISKNMTKLCNYLENKYPDNEGVNRLKERFDPMSIVENEKGNKNTSFTINKGDKIVLCLRSRDDDNEKLHDENTLMFVALHELSHIMTITLHHKQEFWDNFRFVLKNAIDIDIYKYVDYNTNPQKYCGITITDTPLVKGS